MKSLCRILLLGVLALLVTGCATPKPYDYTAFRQSHPRSVLILPPVNNSPEVKATYSVYAQMSVPLAEAGYYVFPVALVDETFRQNGLANPAEIHGVSPAKLREIFGADTALYTTVTEYGSRYTVLDSRVTVTVRAELIDLKTGKPIWAGAATASDAENRNSGGNGLLGVLIEAAVRQVVNSISDPSYAIAGKASARLLSAGRNGAVLYGPYSPQYGQDGKAAE
jgi:hypothetical protein